MKQGLDAWIPILVSRWRDGGDGRQRLSAKEIDRLGSALLTLQRGLTGGRDLIGSSYMDNNDLAGAYLLYYWISSYAQTMHVLNGLGRLYGVVPAGRILDVGAGPGPASAAFVDSGASAITAIEPSPSAIATLSSLFSSRYGSGFPAPVTVKAKAGSDISGAVRDGAPYGAIVFSHSLNEISPGGDARIAARAALVESYAALLKPDGFVLIQEPSLLSTSRDLLSVRDTILGKGFEVIAPCFNRLPCPALAKGPNETCHEEFAWTPPSPVGELAAKAGLDRKTLKMTYVVFSRALPHRRHCLDCVPYRVVSDSMLNKAGKRRFFLCGERGRFTLSAKPELVPNEAAAFHTLKRGDILSFSGTIPTENGEGVTDHTRITVW